MTTAWDVFKASIGLTFERIGLLMVCNFLWWLFSLPLITWPPATAGLYHVVRRLTILEESGQTTWRHFFEGMRLYGWTSWKLAAADFILGAIIITNVFFYLNRSQPVLRLLAWPMLSIVLLWGLMQLYLFPLLIEQQDKRITLVFKNAWLLTLGHLPFSLLFGFLLAVVTAVGFLLFGPVLFVLIAFLAVGHTLALQRLLAALQTTDRSRQ